MPLSDNHTRHAVLFNFLILSFGYFFEVLGFSLLFSDIPESSRELVGNISVMVVILYSAYLKIHPNKRASIITDLLTIVLACVVSMPMMKADSSFLNVFNILCAFGVVIYMAYCTSKEWLNERYERFCDYINRDLSEIHKESESYDKVLRSTTEIAKQYINRVDSKIPDIENYENHFTISIDSERDYKKISENYYNLYRFYREKGFDFRLIKTKKSNHEIKISWMIM